MTNATAIRTSITIIRSHTAELPDGEIVDLPFAPAEHIDPVLSEDGKTLRYAVNDDHCMEYEWQEGVEFAHGNSRWMGALRDADEANEWIDRMSVDHDVFVVDVYEHGNVMFSLSGTGPQCQFDTARGGAIIAIPNANHEYEFTDTEQAARDILAEYTSWCNGDVYGVVEMVKGDDGEWVESDLTCWGFIGWENTEQVLKEGY